MPIVLTTGTPGSGKTLRTLWDVEKLRKESGREVYYHGIKDLLLPWIKLDDDPKFDPDAKPPTFGLMCTEWFKLPHGSIVVLDECQRIFRSRASGSQVPQHVSELETHRHKGFDLFLVTQHPAIIDLNVRRQVQTHRHLKRRFGTQMVSMFSWEGVKDNPDKSVNNSLTTTFRYPKEVFSWYKSAEIHTVKAKVPFKVWFILAAPLIIIALGFFAANRLKGMSATDIEPTEQDQFTPGINGATRAPPKEQQITALQKHAPDEMAEYLASERPRFPELPYTAPKYDNITKPQIAPVYQGCVIAMQQGNKAAFCYLQGGIKRTVGLEFAENFINTGGVFIDFKPDQSELQRQNASGGTQRSEVRGAAPT